MDTRRPTTGWVLETGKAGHANQCIGVMERLGIEPEIKRLRPNLVTRLLAPHGFARDPGRLAPPFPDIVLASGRRTVPYARALRRTGGPVVAMIGKPGIRPDRFDLVWANEHDRLTGANVLTTVTSPHRLTPERLAEGAAALEARLPDLPRPLVGVLVGGPNKAFGFDAATIDALCASLASLADRFGLMITVSRRTPSDFPVKLDRHLAGKPHWLWNGTGENPVFGIFGLAEHLIVTSDSVSMLSEACFTGKPVHAVRLSGGNPKFDRFHRAMVDRDFMHWYDGSLPSWSYDPPDPTGLIAERLLALWQERNPA